MDLCRKGTKDAQKYDASGDHWQQKRSNVAKPDLGKFLMGQSLSEAMADPQGSLKIRIQNGLTLTFDLDRHDKERREITWR